MTKDIFLNRLNDNHIPSLTGRTGHGVTIVFTNILSLTGQMTKDKVNADSGFAKDTASMLVYTIKQHKTLRKQYKNSPDIDFIFITSEDESPLVPYNNPKMSIGIPIVNQLESLMDTIRKCREQFVDIPLFILH